MGFSVIASSPSLGLSGANVLVANLFDRLQKQGCRTEWLVTGHQSAADEAAWLGKRQFAIHRLPQTHVTDFRRRQKLLCQFLEEHSPCVYLPNFDFDMACAIPALSPANKAVMIMHSDDPVYYDFMARHGNFFNATVCVSEFLTGRLQAAYPALRKRIVHIPFGVEPPSRLPARDKAEGQPLDVAYCGRISFHQKRVQDLAAIIIQCHAQNLPVRFHIAGAGPDEMEFFARIREPLAAGKAVRLGFLPNERVLQLMERSDVLLMTSEFEGLPVVLLEAMACGCIPVVTRTESGMTELVRDGENGYLLPIGDVVSFVEALKGLIAEPNRRQQLREAAYESIGAGGFTLERAAEDYQKLFSSLIRDDAKWAVSRNGEMIRPEHYDLIFRLRHKWEMLLNRFSNRSRPL